MPNFKECPWAVARRPWWNLQYSTVQYSVVDVLSRRPRFSKMRERERERYCTGKVDSVEHPNLVLRSGSLGKPSTTSAQYVRAYVALGTVKVGSTNKSPRTQNFNWDRLANKSLRALRSPNASTAVKMHN